MKNFTNHIIPAAIVFMLLVLLALVWVQSESLENGFLNTFQRNMHTRNKLLRQALGPYIGGNLAKLAEEAHQLAKVAEIRITVIDSSGKVIMDTEEAPDRMDNHLGRPEVAEAFKTGAGMAHRFSDTMRFSQIYTAVSAVGVDGKTYVLRIGMSKHSIDEMLYYARRDSFLIGIGMVLLVMVFAILIHYRFRIAMNSLNRQMEQVMAGDSGHRFEVKNSNGAISKMTVALDKMTAGLARQIESLRLEKSKRDIIFASMSEGVIAVDREGIIIDLNPEAARMLEQPTLTGGVSLKSLMCGNELDTFTEEVLQGKQPLAKDIQLHDGHKFLRLRGTLMKVDREIAGVVLVLSDLTRLYQLENFRRDFIANVSHEIKTPLTVISGAIEALKNDDGADPVQSAHFKDMILKQSERLNNLVRDILNISALEHKARGDISEFVPMNLVTVVNGAIDLIKERADAQKIRIVADMPAEIPVNGDPQLLEQAIFNLLDNAVKYSSANEIKITMWTEENVIILKIADNGIGIAREHLPRLFERFYRVDKDRSRKMGGTGLGLAIVKHTIQHHYGAVTADCSPGRGSTFIIRLPLKNLQIKNS